MKNEKKTISFDIDANRYNTLINICEQKNVEMHDLMTEYINSLIEKNINYDNRYFIKNQNLNLIDINDENSVTIIKYDNVNDKILLSNGNILNIYDFNILYDNIDIDKYNNINNFKQLDNNFKNTFKNKFNEFNDKFIKDNSDTDIVDSINRLKSFNNTKILKNDDLKKIFLSEDKLKNSEIEKIDSLNIFDIQSTLINNEDVYDVTDIFKLGYSIRRNNYDFYVFGLNLNDIIKKLNNMFNDYNFIPVEYYQSFNTDINNNFDFYKKSLSDLTLNYNDHISYEILENFLRKILNTNNINVENKKNTTIIHISSTHLYHYALYEVLKLLKVKNYKFALVDNANEKISDFVNENKNN